MNESMHRKNKEGFGMQTNAPYDNGASKRGDLYFKSGKDACMSSNLKSLHTYFLVMTEKSSTKSSEIVDNERNIALMITKNRFWSWNKKKIKWTLPLGKSQRNEKINLVIRRSFQVNPAIEKHQVFKTPRSGIIKSTLQSGSINFSNHVILSGLHQVSHIFFLSSWVCHPLQWDHLPLG